MQLPLPPSSLITSRYTNTERGQSLDSSKVVCSSIDTEYIPLYSMFLNQYFRREYGLKGSDIFSYINYWLPSSSAETVTSVDNLIERFNKSVKPVEYLRDGVTYYIMKHLVYTIINGETIVLYTTIVRRDYWEKITDFQNIDKNKFFYLINNRFLEPQFRSFYIHFIKYYINKMFNHEIDMIWTNDISKYCFKVIESPIQFPTIASMKNYFNDLTKNAIDGFING